MKALGITILAITTLLTERFAENGWAAVILFCALIVVGVCCFVGRRPKR
jgi:hypothetical protein